MREENITKKLSWHKLFHKYEYYFCWQGNEGHLIGYICGYQVEDGGPGCKGCETSVYKLVDEGDRGIKMEQE